MNSRRVLLIVAGVLMSLLVIGGMFGPVPAQFLRGLEGGQSRRSPSRTSAVGGTDPSQAQIDASISSGIQWLVGQQKSTDGSWGEDTDPNMPVGVTGLAVLKLETYAEEYYGKNPLDPSYVYYTNVSMGLNYVFSNAHNITIDEYKYNGTQLLGKVDTNDNGIGVVFYSPPDVEDYATYETGIAAAAISASQSPLKVISVGNPDVDGRTYKDVLTDVVDMLAWSQQNNTDTTYGGWGYGESPFYDGADNSVSGYAVLGLSYAESPAPFGFGLTIPSFVKTELSNYWINYIQNLDGGSGYTDPNGGENLLRTGTLLEEMAFVGDSLSSARAQNALSYIETHWNDEPYYSGWNGTDGAYKQAMFTMMKGFTAFQINTITADSTTVNWYDSFSTVLLNEQQPDGSWPVYAEDDYPILSTIWALLVLEKAAPVLATYQLTVHVEDASTLSSISGALVNVTNSVSTSGITDSAGNVTFQLVGGAYYVNASANNYLPSNRLSITMNKNLTQTIDLTPMNGTIQGWVTNVASAAIVGATITTNGTGVPSALTDGVGYYAISVPPGVYNVTAGASGYYSSYEIAPLVTAGATVTVNFTLTAVPTVTNGTIQGWVTNVASAAIVGATITTNGTGVTPDYTDSSGYYAISVPPGTYNLTASAPGYLSSGPITAAPVTSGAVVTVNFTLTTVPPVANGTINGWVTNVAHSAIAGATITTNGTGVTPASTNGVGYYAISVPPGVYNVTAADSPAYLSSGPITASVTSGTTVTVNFTLTTVPSAPDFSISASPQTLTMMPGTSDNSTVTVTGLNGFTGNVGLAVSPAQGNSTPAGTQLTLISQLTQPFPAAANLTVAIASTAPAGDFWLNVTGASGSLVHFVLVRVIVLSSLPVPEPSVIVGVLMMFLAFAAFYLTRKRKLPLIRNR